MIKNKRTKIKLVYFIMLLSGKHINNNMRLFLYLVKVNNAI